MALDRRRLAASKRHFREFYPDRFHDEDYVVMERLYKWEAHRAWRDSLGGPMFRRLLDEGRHDEIAQVAVRIESRTNLLFSFEKMAVRDAVRDPVGSKAFALGLFDWLHGAGNAQAKFERWVECVAALPRRQTRVLTWPVVTVFGFIGRPRTHLFLKPTVTRRAAEALGFNLVYRSRPQWDTYASVLEFARAVGSALDDWQPRDMIDIQSFIWVLGSSEYD